MRPSSSPTRKRYDDGALVAGDTRNKHVHRARASELHIAPFSFTESKLTQRFGEAARASARSLLRAEARADAEHARTKRERRIIPERCSPG